MPSSDFAFESKDSKWTVQIDLNTAVLVLPHGAVMIAPCAKNPRPMKVGSTAKRSERVNEHPGGMLGMVVMASRGKVAPSGSTGRALAS